MKRLLSSFIIIYLLSIVLIAQDAQNYINYRAGLEDYKGDVKCGTRYDLELKLQFDKLDISQQSLMKEIMAEPVRAESLMTTHFILHWNETGSHAVPLTDISGNGIPDYIDSAAVFLEHVWNVEIIQMGYSAPPQQNGQPVSLYHIYFTNFPMYGLTTGSGIDIPSLPGTNWTSYIELDNDYSESYFHSKGLNGLRVTIAHEFHHAIEFGYNVRQGDFYYYEMTATWLEDVLYDEINDYYNYLNYLYNGLGVKSFDDYSYYCYGNCLYNHMVVQQHGNEFIKDVWDEIKQRPAIDAIAVTLNKSQYDDNWTESLHDYGVWLYFTGDRAKPAEFFPEGGNYPQFNVKNINTYQFGDSLFFSNIVPANSFNYFKIGGVGNKALQSHLKSDNISNGGHSLLSINNVSDFCSIDDTLTGFITSEDSAIFLASNADDIDGIFNATMRMVANFVQVEPLVVEAREGRNILTWTSYYEILNKQWLLSRKKENENYVIIQTIAGNAYSSNKIKYTFVDTEIEEGIFYQYKLEAVFQNDSVETINDVNVNSLSPVKFSLIQNYPNPFNNETTIIAEISEPVEYELVIYNVLGQKIKTLQSKKMIQPGFKKYQWNGDNKHGQSVSGGVYFIVLTSSKKIQKIKSVYIK